MPERHYSSPCTLAALLGTLLLAQAVWAQEQCDCQSSSPPKDVPPGAIKNPPNFDFGWRSRAGKSGGSDCVERAVTNKNSAALYYIWDLAGMQNKSLPPSETDLKCRPSMPPREPVESGPLLYGRTNQQSVLTQVWKSNDEPSQAGAAKAGSFSETLKVAFQIGNKVFKHTVVLMSSAKKEAGSEDYTYDYILRSSGDATPIVRWDILSNLDPKAVAGNASITGQLMKTTDGSTAVLLKEPIRISIKDRRQPATVENWVKFFSPMGEEMAGMRTVGVAPGIAK